MIHNATVRAFKAALGLVVVAAGGTLASSRPADEPADTNERPKFTSSGELIFPADYREWVYVSSGLGMTYGPAKATEGQPPRFDNVFVTKGAYRAFLRSGIWPEQTMFILEVRAADANVSINNGGRSQGKLLAIEASVKEQNRFRDGRWGYFSFDGPDGLKKTAASLPTTATCYSCHDSMAAVDRTFVQFYPTLFDVAKRFKTVRPDYEDAHNP